MMAQFNSTTKSDLIGIVTEDVQIHLQPQSPNVPDPKIGACILIDGYALIQTIGKPTGYHTFGYYADSFARSVFAQFDEGFTRVDVVFYRYIGAAAGSIQFQTRATRFIKGKAQMPIRKKITNAAVSLQHVWAKYIFLAENKEDLACFLSNDLM